QWQGDRAIGLNDHLAIELVRRSAGLIGRRDVACGGERLDADLVSHLQLVGLVEHLARSQGVDGELISHTETVLGDVGWPSVTDVFPLSIRLPVVNATSIPADFALTTAGRTVDRPDVVRCRGSEGLAQQHFAGRSS